MADEIRALREAWKKADAEAHKAQADLLVLKLTAAPSEAQQACSLRVLELAAVAECLRIELDQRERRGP